MPWTADRYNSQTIAFGEGSQRTGLNQIYKNHPAHKLEVRPEINYSYYFQDGGYIQPLYNFTYTSRRKDSRLYEQERAQDNGIVSTNDDRDLPLNTDK